MNLKTSVSADMLHMSFKQLGADKVTMFPTKAIMARFDLNPELTVSYFCEARDEGLVSLQRVEPYPVKNYKFEDVDKIIEFVKRDVAMFENASKSSNFKKFLEIIDKNYKVRQEMEKLFLETNVSPELLDALEHIEDEFLDKLETIERIEL